MHEALERDFPDEQIVGWYHSHPGFGIFLSGHDLFIHENFFSGPSQIAYVVDPHAGTEGVFGWREGKIVVLEEGKARRKGTSGGGMTGRLVALGAGLLLLGGAGAAVMLRDDPPPSKPRSAPSADTPWRLIRGRSAGASRAAPACSRARSWSGWSRSRP